MKKFDLAGGLIWFIIGTYYCIGSLKFGVGSFGRPGPGFMPFISGTLLGFSGLILILSSIGERLRVEEGLDGKEIRAKGSRKRPLFVLLLTLFGYGLLLEFIGFIVTTFIFLFFLFKLTAPKAWIIPLIFSGVTVILSYLIFSIWLRFPFPRGIFNF